MAQQRSTKATIASSPTANVPPPAGRFQPSQNERVIIRSIACATFVASCLPPLAGSALYVAGKRPQVVWLYAIDRVFRWYGGVLPIAPLVLRYAAFVTFPSALSDDSAVRHPVQELLFHAFVQAVRFLVYVLHVMGQVLHVWQTVLGPHEHHVLADHVFLGVAVQAGLAVELAAIAWYGAHVLHGRGWQSRSKGPALGFLAAALLSVLLLQLLVGVDMFCTGRFFHPAREVWTAVALGLPMFGGFAYMNLQAWS